MPVFSLHFISLPSSCRIFPSDPVVLNSLFLFVDVLGSFGLGLHSTGRFLFSRDCNMSLLILSFILCWCTPYPSYSMVQIHMLFLWYLGPSNMPAFPLGSVTLTLLSSRPLKRFFRSLHSICNASVLQSKYSKKWMLNSIDNTLSIMNCKYTKLVYKNQNDPRHVASSTPLG